MTSPSIFFRRITAILMLSLLYGSLVLAVPVGRDEVTPGSILLAKPKHFDPPGDKKAGKHPVVALTKPDDKGLLKVASISHNHPEGTKTGPATSYGLPSDMKDGKDHHVSHEPSTIHHDSLSQIPATSGHPLKGHSVSGDHLENLHSHTGTGK